MNIPFTSTIWKPLRSWCGQYFDRRYKRKFAHARKLFLLDVLLIIGACITLYAGISWVLFSPEDFAVSISFEPFPDRIVSGESISIDIHFQNTSESAISDTNIFLSLHPGFIINRVMVNDITYPTSSIQHLIYKQKILPHERITLRATGQLYAQPGKDAPIGVTAQFTETETQTQRQAFGRFLLVPRDSVLHASIAQFNPLLPGITSTIDITLRNDGTVPLPTTSMFIEGPSGIVLGPVSTLSLEPNEERLVNIPIQVTNAFVNESATIAIYPTIQADGTMFRQERTNITIPIIRSNLDIQSDWNASASQVGKLQRLDVTLHNNGKHTLDNVEFLLSANQINAAGIMATTLQKTINGMYVIPFGERTTSLPPGESKKTSLSFHVKPMNTLDRTVRIPLHVRATIDGTSILLPHTSAPLRVASTLRIDNDVRFYTKEGDQIGRGELPLRVGKETTLWTTITIHNSTSIVENLSLQVYLSPNISWTGNASLSHGRQPQIKNSMIEWNASSIAPFSTAAINLELSVTPKETSRGSSPALLSSITLMGTDSYTGLPLKENLPSISLQDSLDARLLSKGAFVK